MKNIFIKFFLPVTILVLFTSCTNHTDTIDIPLHTEKGYGPFIVSRHLVKPIRDTISYKGVPVNIKEYVVRSYHFQKEQLYWDQFRTGKISEEQFLKYASRYNIDTTKLTKDFVDEEVLFLIGTNQNEKRIIIADADNNEDFTGEKIFEYEYPVSLEEQYKDFYNPLPAVSVAYECFDNGTTVKRTIDVKPSPYLGNLRISYNTGKEIDKKYDLFINVPEYKKSTIRINKTHFDVYVSNGFTSRAYSPKITSLFFCKKGETGISQTKGDIPYQIGDIFNANGADYKIESISRYGDNLLLKYLGENKFPVGVKEEMYLPKFMAVNLNNSVFSVDDYPDKYLLFDFWGTWCNPCIKLIPELKILNQEYQNKNLVIVSVAYDNNIETVSDFVNRENMNWVHLFVNMNSNDKNSIINKLKITSYPSTILIAPDGKIIARNKDTKELKQILDERLITL